MGYKLIQVGHATYGNGDTAEQARADSREWLDNPEDADDVDVYENIHHLLNATVDGDLAIVPDDVADELGDY